MVDLPIVFVRFEQDGAAFGASVVLGQSLADASLAEDVPAMKHHGILVVYADEIVDGVGNADDAGRVFVNGRAVGDGDRGEIGEELCAGDCRSGSHGGW